MASTRAAAPSLPRQRNRRSAAAPVVPLGSLTQTAAVELSSCAACGSASVTRLQMQLGDGTSVAFTSCHRCEHRSWDAQGEQLDVASVLDRSRRSA